MSEPVPEKQSFTIKSWAEEDRPREKLLLKGKAALSDAELIGILLGSGVADLTAVDVAKQMLQKVNNDLNELAKQTIGDLRKNKGIGEARAITIIAALELGRRRKDIAPAPRMKITSSLDIYNHLRPHLLDLPHEEFWVILLNRANIVTQKIAISSGGVAGTVADPKIIFKAALDGRAAAIILAHNHPSGNLTPSQADITLTKKMKEAGQFLDLPVLDHLIFSNDGYYSFADEGVL